MLKWRLSDREWKEQDADELKDPTVRCYAVVRKSGFMLWRIGSQL